MKNVRWLGHSGILVCGSTSVAVDPYDVRRPEPVDIILLTHDHYDHCSPQDIKAMLKPGGLVVLPHGVDADLDCPVKHLRIGDVTTIAGVEISVEPAYNIDKPYHPKSKGYAGYVFIVDGTSYYHAGDTDFIPEMNSIAADVAFLPVSGTYTMDAREAAAAANRMAVKIAVPVHWGSIVGIEKDAKIFKRLCRCQVSILKQE
ncbi:MBL fold metallo-hydrolase [bacterium]|nr:MBL fold metallo-hydrolase [bacterium]